MTDIDPRDNEVLLTPLEAFDVMRKFIEDYWARGLRQSDELAVLLGSLDRDEGALELPHDQALWSDWLLALQHVKATPGPHRGSR